MGVKALGSLIRSYRFLRDMSLRDLGDAAGIHYSYVGKLEKGTAANPSREVVRGLAIALNAPVDEFEMAAGYLPAEATTKDTKRDIALSSDVQRAVDLILEELESRRHNNKDR